MNHLKIIAQNPKTKEVLRLIELNSECCYAVIEDEESRRIAEYEVPLSEFNEALEENKIAFETLLKVFQDRNLRLKLLGFEPIK